MDFDEDPNYLDLEDLLAQTQSVECQFLLDIPGLEFLAADKSEEIKQGTKLTLPFWMAKTLYTYSMADITLPQSYDVNFRETLEADPYVVDLHRAGPHYYRFGKLLMDLKRERGNNLEMFTEEGHRNKYRREEGETLQDRKSIAISLMKTFHFRRHRILTFSISGCVGDDMQGRKAFEPKLDVMERRLYEIGKQRLNEIIDWDSSRSVCKKIRYKK